MEHHTPVQETPWMHESLSGMSLLPWEMDAALKSINSDYEAKRHKDIALRLPEVVAVPKGTFSAWLASKGKLGGQHKVPRLSNDRTTLEEIKQFVSSRA